MANFYTSDELIVSIKNRGMIPENQKTFQPADFLRLANEEMMMGIVPMVMQLHEDHFMRTETVPMVANQSRYAIPYRAIGNKLRDVAYSPSAGIMIEMIRIPKDDIFDYQTTNASSNQYVYFYIENNEVVLVPQVQNATGSLVFTYYCRPSSLVLTSQTGKILGIDRNTGEITLDKIPSAFSVDELFDFVIAKSPHKSVSIDLSPSSINGLNKSITFNVDDIPDDLVIGDYVTLAEQSPIPQIPSDLHSLLVQRVVCRCLEATGDAQGLQSANVKLAEMEEKAAILIDNRVEASPQKVVNRHGIMGWSSRTRSIRRF